MTYRRSKIDPALYTATFTPGAPGVYLIGVASGTGWAASAPINVPS